MNTKTYSGNQARLHIQPLLETAKESLWLVSPWIGKDYAVFLASLSKNGIEVRIITTKNPLNLQSIEILSKCDNPHMDLIVLDSLGTDGKAPFIHSKIYLADKKVGISGSANLTFRGLNVNFESLSIADTQEEVNQLERDFMRLWIQHGKERMSKEELSAKEELPKEELSANTSYSIRNALPLPYLGFIEQPHIERKELVYHPYFFFEYSLRGSVTSTPLVFEDHAFLVVDGINRQIIDNDNSLIQEIDNKTPTDYTLKTENKYSLEIKQLNNLNLREAHELALEYVIKKNTKKYKKYKDEKGAIRYYVPESKGMAFIKENTQFYGQKSESRVYVPQRSDISFIREHFVYVPIWYLVMYEPDGKHQKIMLGSSGKVWSDLVFCPVCENKVFVKDSVNCTVCSKLLCQKCVRETGLILKKKYCPSCYQNIPSH